MTTTVITDSAAALPPQLAAELGIGVIPILMTVDGREVAEGEMSNAELLAADVKTSAPTPGAFTSAIRSVGQGGVLIVTVGAKLSATHQAALIGSEAAQLSVRVFDSGTAAGAQGLIAVAAARVAAAGGDLSEVAAAAALAADRVTLIGALSGLAQLVKTGRIPALAGRAGDRIGVKPLFEIRGGEIRRLRPARSPEAASDRMLGRLERALGRAPDSGDVHVAVMHADAPDDASALLAGVEKLIKPRSAFVGGFGQALISAAGTGVTGLAWWQADPTS